MSMINFFDLLNYFSGIRQFSALPVVCVYAVSVDSNFKYFVMAFN